MFGQTITRIDNDDRNSGFTKYARVCQSLNMAFNDYNSLVCMGGRDFCHYFGAPKYVVRNINNLPNIVNKKAENVCPRTIIS